MKKFLSVICGVLLVGILAITFTSCSKEEKVSPMVKKLKFNVNVVNGSATDTKVVKSSWENGDKIYLFFNVSGTGHLDAIKYATLTYNGTSWDGAIDAGSSLDAEDLGSAGTMYGVFFPFGGVDIASDGGAGVTFKTAGNTNPSLNGQPIYTYYMTGNASYTVVPSGDIANLDGTITLTMPDNYVYFFVNKDDVNNSFNLNEMYTLSAEGLIPTACTSFSGGTFSESSLSLGDQLLGYYYVDAGLAFSGKIDGTWTGADHQFSLYYDGYPIMSKTYNNSLSSHKSIRLNLFTWTKTSFRGFVISKGILEKDGGVYKLTTGTNQLETVPWIAQDASLGKYYHKWETLRTDLGTDSDGHSIKSTSENLPKGWNMPGFYDWKAILGTSTGITVNGTPVDYGFGIIQVTGVTVKEKTVNLPGILLIPDNTAISCANLSSSYIGPNCDYDHEFNRNVNADDITSLTSQGCLFLPLSGRYDGVFEDFRRYPGHSGSAQVMGYYLAATASYDPGDDDTYFTFLYGYVEDFDSYDPSDYDPEDQSTWLYYTKALGRWMSDDSGSYFFARLVKKIY